MLPPVPVPTVMPPSAYNIFEMIALPPTVRLATVLAVVKLADDGIEFPIIVSFIAPPDIIALPVLKFVTYNVIMLP